MKSGIFADVINGSPPYEFGEQPIAGTRIRVLIIGFITHSIHVLVDPSHDCLKNAIVR